MQIESIIYRIAVVPTRHYLAAGAMAAALGFGAWFGVRHMPAEYLGSALLSYQSPGQFLADSATSESDVPTSRIAGSILTPAVLAKLADQTHFTTDATPSSSNSNAGDARLDAFRSHIDVEQSGPGLLRVTYRGNDPQQVTASANALAAAIAAWVPKPVPDPQVSPQPAAAPAPSAPQHLVAAAAPVASVAATTPAPALIAPQPAASASQPAKNAAQLEHRAAALQEDLATLELQRQEIDSRLQSLATEQKRLQRPASNTAAGNGDAAEGRARLKAIAKETTSLRILRSSLVEQLQDGKQRFELLKAQALGTGSSTSQPSVSPSAAPVAAPAPINTAARQSESAAATVPAAATAAQFSPQEVPAIVDPLKEEDAREQRSWQGAFTVLSWSDKSYALEDDRNRILQIGGIVTAILFPAIYLALVAWRFRPVSNAASLRRVLPRGMKYYGAVSGTPISEKTS
jgi:hypothetical protein